MHNEVEYIYNKKNAFLEQRKDSKIALNSSGNTLHFKRDKSVLLSELLPQNITRLKFAEEQKCKLCLRAR